MEFGLHFFELIDRIFGFAKPTQSTFTARMEASEKIVRSKVSGRSTSLVVDKQCKLLLVNPLRK